MPSRPHRRRDSAHTAKARLARRGRTDRAIAAVDDLRRIIRALRVAARRAETELGLSGAQLFVLQQLAERPAASLNELAGRTLTHQSSVSVVVQRLVARGLVSRGRSAADGRRIELRLTQAGDRLVRRVRPAPQAPLVETIRGLRPADLRTLARLLRRIAEAMGAARLTPDMMFADSAAPRPPRRPGE